MQLEKKNDPSALREKLGHAALALALLDIPAAAHADSATTSPTPATTQFDLTSLVYTEQDRTQIIEPLVRVTRLFGDGQSLSAQFGLDVMTGATPTGALPQGRLFLPAAGIQTATSASGQPIRLDQIPTANFNDQRFGFDGDWHKPLSRLISSDVGGHFSKERDYQSIGINGKLAFDLNQRLTTLTLGGGYNHDSVFPVGGTPDGLSDGTIISNDRNPKRVKNLVLGLSQVLTRRWLVSLNASRTFENGYLTEPYKVISVVGSLTGTPFFDLTDKRPSTRNRTSLLFNSVYQLGSDVLYVSYRYYWDTWNLRSNTIDLKYRHDIASHVYVEPHARYYKQTPADFYTIQLLDSEPPPEFATADNRLGPLKTVTIGSTIGFRFANSPNEWTVRPEYIRQTGDSFPDAAIGIERTFNLSPTINTFALVVGYSFNL